MSDSALCVLGLVCTLTHSPGESSTQLLCDQLLEEFAGMGASTHAIRVVDHDVRPGIQTDMGDGDAWPELRRQILQADILVLATPTWLGQHSSVCQNVLERLDAELSQTDERGRPTMYGKVGAAAVVGNEDGAHHVSAVLFQALNDVGLSLAAQAVTYWHDDVKGEHRD